MKCCLTSRLAAALAGTLPLLAVLAPTTQVAANGRMPGANEVAFDRQAQDHLWVRTTFGLLHSGDAGGSWYWICEDVIGASGVVSDPPLAIAPKAVVLLPPTGGALTSSDQGCSWQPLPAPVAGERGVDLTHDPRDLQRLLLLTSSLSSVNEQGFGSYRNLVVHSRDGGDSFQLLATLAEDFEAETIEVAPNEGGRIYVSGTDSRDPRLGVLYLSDDGGSTWQKRTLALPPGTGSMFISGIHPDDPDTLWVRVPARGDTIGLLPGRLYVSRDAGQSFQLLATTKRAMFGFALSPDGSQLAYGGPADGLFVGSSSGSEFSKVSNLGVRCLRWPRQDALYACASEPQDPFSLGLSRDQGLSFEPLYRMRESCPSVCVDGGAFMQSCENSWRAVAPQVQAAGDMCAVEWATAPDASVPDEPSDPDAGTPHDAGESDADAGSQSGEPDASTPSRARSDGGCHAASGRAPLAHGGWLWACALLLLRRRRGQA